VKGTTATKLSNVLFRYFTNAQYEKAKECLCNNQHYEIHLVVGIGTPSVKHYCIPAEVFIKKARREIAWALPILEEMNIENYQVNDC
jgi:hypothetical protein